MNEVGTEPVEDKSEQRKNEKADATITDWYKYHKVVGMYTKIISYHKNIVCATEHKVPGLEKIVFLEIEYALLSSTFFSLIILEK